MRILRLALSLTVLTAFTPVSGQTLVVEKPEFRQLVPDDAVLEKLATGFKFLEGPAWNAREAYLVFSDIPGDKMYRYDPATNAAVIFRAPSHNANGNFYDPSDDALYTCEHGSRTVTVERGKVVATLATEFEDKRLNSPNDVVVKSDGTIWFTDPTYGVGKAPKEQATNNVYYLGLKGELRAVVTDFVQPNGLCFSPDEKLLYIADSGNPPQQVRVFDVTADNRLVNGRLFCEIDHGVPDGMRVDRHGNLFTTAGDGIQIYAPDGTRLGKILVPETPANLCFGGESRDELYITARTCLYRIKLSTSAPLAK